MTQIRQMTTDFCWANAMNSTQMSQTEAQMTADFFVADAFFRVMLSEVEASQDVAVEPRRGSTMLNRG